MEHAQDISHHMIGPLCYFGVVDVIQTLVFKSA